jgi:carboxyl-terminal processing protease
VGEKSFGAGAEQQLFTLRGGDGLLLTTIKWASASGKPFLGEDRSHSGVAPSVEVKRPELADAIDPEDLTGNDDDPVAKPGQANDKPQITGEPNTPKPSVEDLQMKKAIELLRENKQLPLQKAA